MNENESHLNSGTATPEFYDEANRHAWHVYNVEFASEESRSRVVKFVMGRMRHFQTHLPSDASQTIRFDLRGQFVSEKTVHSVRETLVQYAASLGIELSVEYLTN